MQTIGFLNNDLSFSILNSNHFLLKVPIITPSRCIAIIRMASGSGRRTRSIIILFLNRCSRRTFPISPSCRWLLSSCRRWLTTFFWKCHVSFTRDCLVPHTISSIVQNSLQTTPISLKQHIHQKLSNKTKIYITYFIIHAMYYTNSRALSLYWPSSVY